VSAHAAVFRLLSTDLRLTSDWSIDASRVWPSYAIDTAMRTGYFLVLKWEEVGREPGFDNEHGAEVLTVFCHRTKSEVADFGNHRIILNRVITVLKNAIQVPGDDGVLNQAFPQGMSGDITDEIYGTLTKSAEFSVLSR
jgi:hypothetical protein